MWGGGVPNQSVPDSHRLKYSGPSPAPLKGRVGEDACVGDLPTACASPCTRHALIGNPSMFKCGWLRLYSGQGGWHSQQV